MARDSLTPAQKALRARIASHASWANTADPSARTSAGRSAFLERFEREVDPEGVLPEAERKRRAEHKRKQYFAQLAFKSARARRRKAGSS